MWKDDGGRSGVIDWGRGEEWSNWMMGGGGMMGEDWSDCVEG